MHCIHTRIGLLALMALTCSADDGVTMALDISIAPDTVFYLPAGGEKQAMVGLIPIRSAKATALRVETRQRAQSVEIEVTALDRNSDGDPLQVGKTTMLLKWKGTPIGTFKGKIGDSLSIPLDKIGLSAISLKIVSPRRSPLPDGGPFCAVRNIAAPNPGSCMGMGLLAVCCRPE